MRALALAAVLALVAAPAVAQTLALKALGGREMADVVLVTGADGYQVALGLAEADPGTRPNRIIIADRVDGAPLGPKDGPFKLVIEGDLRPARGARMVTGLTLIRLGQPAR